MSVPTSPSNETDLLPSASVVVPTYARPDQIAACVRALRKLDYPAHRFEIIVVDDGSPVAVDSAIQEEEGPHVRVLRQENAGPARARNLGAEASTGEVLAFTDDDCRPEPAWLRNLVAKLVEEPNALVGGRTVNALEDNLLAEASQNLVDFLYGSFPGTKELRPFFTSNNIAASAEVFRRMGGFDGSFRFSAGEDRDLSERWVGLGPLRFVPEAEVKHYHALSPTRFLRQHLYYGRGAAHLARRRELRGERPPKVESLSFYRRMLTHPYRVHGVARGTAIAGLVAASQIATLSGVLWEVLQPSAVEGDAP